MLNSSNSIAVPENAVYFRYSTLLTQLDSMQLEQGSVVTSYEEYIEPKTYILNDNNVYEEFMKKEEKNIYSTAEQAIGTWIDGKTIYRKVIEYEPDLHVSGSRTTEQILHNISNIEILIELKVSAKQNGQLLNYVFPYISDTNDNGQITKAAVVNKVSETAIEFTVINDGWAGQTFHFILEYTKTTD